MKSLIGLKIITIRGECFDRRIKYFEPKYILFNDKKTILSLHEHDEVYYAKIIDVYKDEEEWNKIFNDTVHYPIANKF